ncbi:MAG: response regulator [Proteobacteria bacterium]|nr:response regulator [Pseudomonadota bacterium]MBU1715223.1 response regulator [Pseudomonadota bacterium]
MDTMKGKSYKILIIDDEPETLRALELAFINTDYRIKTCDDPFLAYRMIEDQHFDVVISDIMMPGMDGLTLLKKIKDFNGMIQVIIISGDISINNTIKAFRYGASDIFFKPFEDINEIIKAVDDTVQKINRVNQILSRLAKDKRS